MGRKPKRVRDANRSHTRQTAPPLPPRPMGARATAGARGGWQRYALPPSIATALGQTLHRTPLTGQDWSFHSGEGEQGNDLPMRQLNVRSKKVWREMAQSILLELPWRCPRCNVLLASHSTTAIDLNVIDPGAALWPHVDVDHQGKPAIITLLQPAVSGGLFYVAKRPHEDGVDGVAWRGVEEGPAIARRARDMDFVHMLVPGDVCMVNGCDHVHEVTRVTGARARVTLSITPKCPKREVDV